MVQIFSHLQDLRTRGKTALMPFITAGDPDLSATAELILALDQAGCDMLELGFPYSDPIADGPVIQAAYSRALHRGIRVQQIFDLIAGLRGKIKMPVVAMVSYSIIFRHGEEEFVKRVADAGFAGLIVPDLPIEEAEQLVELCRRADLGYCPLITPLTDAQRGALVAQRATGFVYFVSVVGITGERADFTKDLKERIAQFRDLAPEVPICLGFGISTREHVEVLSPLVDGIIIGSAIVRRIEANIGLGQPAIVNAVKEFVQSLR
ncbi:MAG TPA: tryptophan synthase subunit alpha [Pirellulaceae bacterium]|nr:tryptophan synthase subunit alpha [Pirellulaceae bacterium]HMO93347.1 tryptophan synthase subunit alpha [Pirellulaceae bacterium]HMP70118.1 tryptophan synthase subunit alpha [Pirellulaceae bacterium]